MTEREQLPYGGAADHSTRELSFARRFRRHAEWLVRSGRSPLCTQLLLGAAGDIDAGGRVAELFNGVDAPPGSVPQLRLLAALHELVLAGDAPALSEFYPSVGGTRAAAGVWPAAATSVDEHFEWLSGRVRQTVQTNEPGRAAVMFAALLWLTDRFGLPIRLLELGASAGLNLLVDRYCYVVDGCELGDRSSLLRFLEPWTPGPPIDIVASAAALRIGERAGCDLAPLNPSLPEHRLRLLSYIWPDEVQRIERARTALAVAGADPIRVVARPASEWLSEMLERTPDGHLTVVWHSVFRQYVTAEEWDALEAALRRAPAPTVELAMEPSVEKPGRFELSFRDDPDEEYQRLAWCGDHGPPVLWQ